MNPNISRIFIRCYAALWFCVGAYYAIMLLSAINSQLGGFALGFAVIPLVMSAISLWLWFARDIWGKRIITIVLGLYATMFVMGKPWLALISLMLMAVTLWITKYTRVTTPKK